MRKYATLQFSCMQLYHCLLGVFLFFNFIFFVASPVAVPMVGLACSSHYPGHMALLGLLAAWLSSSLIGVTLH